MSQIDLLVKTSWTLGLKVLIIPFYFNNLNLKNKIKKADENKTAKATRTVIGNKDRSIQAAEMISIALHISNLQLKAFIQSCLIVLRFYTFIIVNKYILTNYNISYLGRTKTKNYKNHKTKNKDIDKFLEQIYLRKSQRIQIQLLLYDCLNQRTVLMMENQNNRSLAQSNKLIRKISFSSHLRSSGVPENARTNDNPRYNYNDFETLFDWKSGKLDPLYTQTIRKSNSKAVMHFGICLQFQNILHIFKQLFADTGKSSSNFIKMVERKDNYQGIYFIPFWQYKIENCLIIFWVIQKPYLKQLMKRNQSRRWVDIFSSYPQIILSDSQSYQILCKGKLFLNKYLKYQQQLIVFKDKYEIINPQKQQRIEQNNLNYQMHLTDNIEKKTITNYILLNLKRNSKRCIQQSLRINQYIIESLTVANPSLKNQSITLTQIDKLAQVLDLAASMYISQQIQKKYQMMIQAYKTRAANQKELQNQLTQNEEQCLKEIKRNLKIIQNQKKQRQFYEQTEKKIKINNQQISLNNRQLIKKQNNQILSELYEKLLEQFDKGRYTTSKDRVNLMAEDLEIMMEDYEKKAIKSESLFYFFNTFFRNNRNKYYQKIQSLEEQIDQNRKITTFDDIIDKIEMKKKVLFTLQKQVKNMENKKAQIQVQNERLKKIQKQLHQKIHQTDPDQQGQAQSIKSFKTKPISIGSPRFQANNSFNKNNSQMMVFNIEKNNKNKNKNKKKRKCCSCRCAIF